MFSGFPSMRAMRRQWKLASIAVFSLAIAIALGVVGLSVTNTILILPPAAPAPDRLVAIYARAAGKPIDQISYPDYQYYRDNNHVFTDVAAAPNSINVNADFDETGNKVEVITKPVTENYFGVLGIRPYLGHFFSHGDDQSNTRAAVMMYSCWERMGSDRHIVGKKVAGYTITGVAPKEFTGSLYGLNGDLVTPLTVADYDRTWFTKRDARRLFLIARLKPGASRGEAQAEMSTLSGQLATAYPKEDKGRTAVVTRATLLPPDLIPNAELMGTILMAFVLLVLLIACANVANLLLAIAVGRRQEAAIKLALGAPRGRLIREFLKESAVLSVASGVLGFVIAAAVIARYLGLERRLAGAGHVLVGAQPPFGRNRSGFHWTSGSDCRLGDRVGARALCIIPKSFANPHRRDGCGRNAKKRPQEHAGDHSGRRLHAGAGGHGLVPKEPVQPAPYGPWLLGTKSCGGHGESRRRRL